MISVPTNDELLAAIEAFLKRSGMKPTRFGLEAVGEGNFVNSLRGGRSVTLTLANRVVSFIRDQEPASSGGDADPSPDNGCGTIDRAPLDCARDERELGRAA
jgi:hypothetical protein